MANSVNLVTRSTSLPALLATSVSDGTFEDVLETTKVDLAGHEVPATGIADAGGQLIANLVDDATKRVIQEYYKGVKLWSVADATERDALGSDDELEADDLLYQQDVAAFYTCASVDGASASTWTALATPVGPASATDNAVARWDGASGKILQNSTVTIDDSGLVTAACVEIGESAAVPGPTIGAGAGRFWVENTAPSRPKFTDDTNADHTVATIGQFSSFQNFTNLVIESVSNGSASEMLAAGGIGFPTSSGQIVATDWVDYTGGNAGVPPTLNGTGFSSIAGEGATLGIDAITLDLDTQLSTVGDRWLYLMQTTTRGVIMVALISLT